MASGVFLPLAAIASAISNEIALSGTPSVSPNDLSLSIQGPWTPPQYSRPAVTILTVPATGNPILVSTGSETSAPVYRGGTPATDYVFDAVLKVEHSLRLTKTQHPTLSGAPISDHAYRQPIRVSLQIGMSDAMSSYRNNVWVGASTKSISAYQILRALWDGITPLTLTTRLDTYYNMLIENISTPDDNTTGHGLKATVTLEEVISAKVSSISPVSARPQASDKSYFGVVQSMTPSDAQLQQNALPSSQWPDAPTYPNVPGAGNVSSNSLGQITE